MKIKFVLTEDTEEKLKGIRNRDKYIKKSFREILANNPNISVMDAYRTIAYKTNLAESTIRNIINEY